MPENVLVPSGTILYIFPCTLLGAPEYPEMATILSQCSSSLNRQRASTVLIVYPAYYNDNFVNTVNCSFECPK